ncbi:MAG: BatA domain-containing protein [bacterium]|nr:BatA domain-containing protein [bacterium]
MFSFLNATALFAAAAALIPLIIHLFSRRRVKIVEFSSLKHLKAMQRRQVRRLKVRQILLLILRMLIILAIVIAFARPTSKTGMVGSHASVSAVLLFDNSASMNRYVANGNLFDLAKLRAEELLASFGQSDEVMLIPLSHGEAESIPPAFGSAASAKQRLAAIEPGSGQADIQSAIEGAISRLQLAQNVNKEIFLISDRQRHALPERSLLDSVDAKLYFVDLPIENVENCGVTGVDFGGQLIQPGLEFNLTATLKNYGVEARSDLLASLFLDGKRVSQSEAQLAAGAEGSVRFSHTVSGTGFHAGYVELSDDKFQADNRYYFSFQIPDRFNLMLVTGDESSRFIELALMPSPQLSQAWSIKTVAPSLLSGVDFGEYDVVVLAGAPRLEQGYVDRIRAFVQSGRALFVVYGGNTDINEFNNSWSSVTGVTLTEAVRQQFTRAGFYTLESIDLQHPIFSVFGLDGSKPPEIKFYTLPGVTVAREARRVMMFSGDRPALVETMYGEGKVMTFAAPMSPQYTDLPGHAFFVPMISRIAEYLAANLSSLDTRLFVGSAITRALPTRESMQYSLNLLTPDSLEYILPPEESQGSLVVRARPVERPGIYSISYLGREVDRFAANLQPEEADLASVDQEQFAASLGAKEYKELAEGEPIASSLANLRFGRELWHLFAWAAAILLALEMILARGAEPEE